MYLLQVIYLYLQVSKNFVSDTHYWAKIPDNKGQVDTFILDFEKAFDTPPPHMNSLRVNCLVMELVVNIEVDKCFSMI